MPPTISVCMIVKNEEKVLSQCLESVKGLVDEIIVVDTGSTDRSVQIATGFGAKVFSYAWHDDFSAAKNAALKQDSMSWTLVLDADEVVARKDMELLREIIAQTKAWGLEVQQRNYTSETALYGWQPSDRYAECRGPGFFVSPIVRVFRNHPRVRFRYPIHEEVDSSILEFGKSIEVIDFPIHHYGYLKGSHVLKEKREKYLRIGRRAEVLFPDDPKPLYEMGKIHLHEGRYAEAEQLFQRVARLDPNHKLVFTNLGESLFKRGKVKEAVEAYKESIQRVPKNENAYINLGHILYNEGMMDAAAALFRRALEVHPASAAAFNNLVLTLLKQTQIGEAVAVLELAIRMTGLDKFKETLEKIKQKFPEEFRIQELIKRKEYAAAEQALRERLTKDQLDVVSLTNLGLVFSKAGEPEKMTALFEEALQKNDADKSPLWINLRLNLANAYAETGRKQKAIDLLKRTIELNPPRVEILKQRLAELEE